MGALVLLSHRASRFEEVHFDKFAALHQDALFCGCPPTLGQAIDNGHSISIWIRRGLQVQVQRYWKAGVIG